VFILARFIEPIVSLVIMTPSVLKDVQYPWHDVLEISYHLMI